MICTRTARTQRAPRRQGAAAQGSVISAADKTDEARQSDKTQHGVLERFKIYQTSTKPLVDFYRGRATFRSINGAQPLDRVAADMAAAVEAIASSSSAAGLASGGRKAVIVCRIGPRRRLEQMREGGRLGPAKC